VTAPTITGATAISLTEGDAPVYIDQGLSFVGGSNYAGGFLRFNVDNANAGDQFVLNSASNVNASGAISVDENGLVYLGNGSTRDQIGTIDSVENGQNGAALKINIGVSTDAVTNPSFENNDDGWTIVEDRVLLGTTVINGWLTPQDNTHPQNSTGDTASVINWNYNSEFSTTEFTAGANSLRLYNSGTTDPHGVVHGPYAYSDTFVASVGEVFLFDWKAAAGSDAYDTFGYLLNVNTGQTWTLVDETGTSSSGQKAWTTEAVAVPEDGEFSFVFVAGTYDFNGGTAAGGSLYVDNIRTMTSSADDSVLKAIAEQVTFQSTSDAPATGPRALTVQAADSLQQTNSDSADVEITAVNDAPTGGLSVSGSFKVGEILTVTDTIDDADGFDPTAVTYQWQRGNGGSWADIAGAVDDTYEITSADNGYSIRLVAKFTDDGGTEETVTSNAIGKPAPPPPPPVFDEQGNVNFGTTGNDTMSAQGGDDEVHGGFGSDFLNGNQGNDVLYGNQGADTLHGGQGDDIVRGGQDEDMVFGDLGDDQLFGDLGGDLVDGGEGNDILWGGQGLVSSAADIGDTLSGGAGDDYANGNAGNDIVDGGIGNDTLHGGQGDDIVIGGDGDDVVFGDAGNDTLTGGSGADAFHFHGGGRDVVTDFNLAEGDRIYLDTELAYTATQQGADTVIEWSNGEIVLQNVQLSTLTGDWIVA
jgi:Ca2+-binding RTX toxin-like protein